MAFLMAYRSNILPIPPTVTAKPVSNYFVRFQDYYAQKYHLFMLDFCYFMNLSVIVQTSIYPENMLWFKVSEALCIDFSHRPYNDPIRPTMFCAWELWGRQ